MAQGVRRRYYDDVLPEEDIAALNPYGEDQPIEEEGPTEELPFRFTEHSLNPRAEATTGMAQRDPRARSAYTGHGLQQAKESGMTGELYDKQLPLRYGNIATGNVSQYEGLTGFSDISNPMSLRGREQIAGLSGFEGTSQRTQMFDIKAIGKGMGMKDEAIDQLMNVKYKDQYYKTESKENEEGRVSTSRVGTAMTKEQALEQGLNLDDLKRSRVVDSDISELTKRKGGIRDEAAFLRGLMKLSGDGGKYSSGADQATGRQSGMDLKLHRPEQIAHIANMGRQELGGGWGGVRYDKGIGNDAEDSLYKYQKRQGRDIRQTSAPKTDWTGNIMKTAVIMGLTGITGGALAPMIGPVAAGMVAGGAGGAMSQLGSGEKFNWKQVGIGAALGGAGGYAASKFAGTPQTTGGATGTSAGQSRSIVGQQEFGPSVMGGGDVGQGGIQSFDHSGLQYSGGGGVGTTGLTKDDVLSKGSGILDEGIKQYADDQALQEGVRAQRGAMSDQGSARQASVSQARSAFAASAPAGIFGMKLPDSEFYDPMEDMESAQQGVF